MSSPSLILASSSPRRREIVAMMGIPFTIIAPHVDETRQAHEVPLAYVTRLSEHKARSVAPTLSQDAITRGTVILAADTIVTLSDKPPDWRTDSPILGKPSDENSARSYLIALRHKPHYVCTAFTLHRPLDLKTMTTSVHTRVVMRDYTDGDISAYIATGDPFDKAGGYAIQHPTFAPVARIEGSYSNVVGLPADEVAEGLRLFGFMPEMPVNLNPPPTITITP